METLVHPERADKAIVANGWKIYTKKTAYETLTDTNGDLVGSKKIKLSKNALFLFDFQDGELNSGGLIYWSVNKFIWIQQGE